MHRQLGDCHPGLDQCLIHRRGIALVRRLQGHCHHRAGVQIDGVLGLVGQVRTAFIFATRASSSTGLFHSLFEVRFLRLRSNRAKSSRVGVSIPDALASPVRNSS